eukprot:GHVU01175229.1.p1 GENE.GHVU01175229.1~~GHVU01175229.1.p1  ORF type:complete len:178 (+),score=13.71 GHVU01175229.1:1081-1614(+)
MCACVRLCERVCVCVSVQALPLRLLILMLLKCYSSCRSVRTMRRTGLPGARQTRTRGESRFAATTEEPSQCSQPGGTDVMMRTRSLIDTSHRSINVYKRINSQRPTTPPETDSSTQATTRRPMGALNSPDRIRCDEPRKGGHGRQQLLQLSRPNVCVSESEGGRYRSSRSRRSFPAC